MRIKLFVLMTIMMTAVVSVTFISCGDDEPETPIIGTPDNNDSNNDNDNNPKDKIVGKWEAISGSLTYYDYTQELILYIVLDIKKDGTFTYIHSGDYNGNGELTVKEGTWKYNSSTQEWSLSAKYSVIEGEYTLLEGNLICNTQYGETESRTVIYEKYNEQDVINSVVGTWKYSFSKNSYCLLAFDDEEGVTYKKYNDGKWEEDYYIYKYQNGNLTLYEINEDAEIGDVIKVIKVSVLTSKKMLLKDWPSEGMNILVRQ